MSYLFVLVVVVVVVALVLPPVDGVLSLLQPVTKAPITSPNSTTRVYVLFIGGVTFDQFRKKASSFFGASPPGVFTPPYANPRFFRTATVEGDLFNV
jgi:hypothetical protein